MYFRMILFSYTCIVSILEFVVAVQADTKQNINNNELSLSLSNEQVTEFKYEKTIQSATTENNQDQSITTNISTEFVQKIHSTNEQDLNIADSSDLNSAFNMDIMSEINMLNNNGDSSTNDYKTQMSTLEISNTKVKIEGDNAFMSPNGIKDAPNYNNPTKENRDLTHKRDGQDYDSNGNKISDNSIMNSYQSSSYYGYDIQNMVDQIGEISTTATSSPGSNSSPSSATPTSSNGNSNSSPNSKQKAATTSTTTPTSNSNGSPSTSSPKSPTGDSTGKPNGQDYDSNGNKISDNSIMNSYQSSSYYGYNYQNIADLNGEIPTIATPSPGSNGSPSSATPTSSNGNLNSSPNSKQKAVTTSTTTPTSDSNGSLSSATPTSSNGNSNSSPNSKQKAATTSTTTPTSNSNGSPSTSSPKSPTGDLTGKPNGQDYDSNGNKISDNSIMNSYQSSSYYGYNYQNIADLNGEIPTIATPSPGSNGSPSSATPTSSNGNLNSSPNSKQKAATTSTTIPTSNSNGSPSTSSPKSPTGDSTGKPNGQNYDSNGNKISDNSIMNSYQLSSYYGYNYQNIADLNGEIPTIATPSPGSNGSPSSATPTSSNGNLNSSPNSKQKAVTTSPTTPTSDSNGSLSSATPTSSNGNSTSSPNSKQKAATTSTTTPTSNSNGSPSTSSPKSPTGDSTGKPNGQDYDSNGNKISDNSIMNSYQLSSYYGYNYQNIADLNGEIPTIATPSPGSNGSPSSATPTSSNGNLNSSPNSKQKAATTSTTTPTSNSNGSPSTSSPKSLTGDSTGKPNGQDYDSYGNKISDNSIMNSYQLSSYYGYNYQNIADLNGEIPTIATPSPGSNGSPSSATPTSSNGNLNSSPNSKQKAVTTSTTTPPSNSNGSPSSATPTSSIGNSNSSPNSKQKAATTSTTTPTSNSNGSPSTSSPKSPTGDLTGKPNGQDYDSNGNKISDNSIMNSYQSSSYYGYNYQNIADLNGEIPTIATPSPGSNGSPSSATPTSSNGNLNSSPNSKQKAATTSTTTPTSNSNGSPSTSSPKSPTGDLTGKPNGQDYDSNGNKISDNSIMNSYQSSSYYGYNFQNIADLNGEIPTIATPSPGSNGSPSSATPTSSNGNLNSSPNSKQKAATTSTTTPTSNSNGSPSTSSPKSPTGDSTGKPNGQDYDFNGNKISDNSIMNSYQLSSYYGYNYQNIADLNGEIPTIATPSPGSNGSPSSATPTSSNGNLNSSPNSKQKAATTSTTTPTSNSNGSPSTSSPKSLTGDSTGKPNGQDYDSNGNKISDNSIMNSYQSSSYYGYNYQNIADLNGEIPTIATPSPGSNGSPSSATPTSSNGNLNSSPNSKQKAVTTSTTTPPSNSNGSPSSATPTSSNGNSNSSPNSKQKAATTSTTTPTSNSNGSPSTSSPKSPTGDLTGKPNGQDYDSNGNKISDNSIMNSYQSSSYYGYNYQNIADLNGEIPTIATPSPGSNGSPSSATPTSSNGNLNSSPNSKQKAATTSTTTPTSNSNGSPSTSSPKSPTGDLTGKPNGQDYDSNGNKISDNSIMNSYQLSSYYGYNYQNIADLNGEIPTIATPSPGSNGSPSSATPTSSNGNLNSSPNSKQKAVTTSPITPTSDSNGSLSSATPTSSNGNSTSSPNSKQKAATTSTTTPTSNSNGSPSTSSPKSPTGDSTGKPNGQDYDSNGNKISDNSIMNNYLSASYYGYNFQNIADLNGEIPTIATPSPGSNGSPSSATPTSSNGNLNSSPNSKQKAATTSTTTPTSNSNGSPSSSTPKSLTGDSTGKPIGQDYDSNGNKISDNSIMNSYLSASYYGYNFQNIADLNGEIPTIATPSPGSNGSPSSATPTSSNGNLNSSPNSKQKAATTSTTTPTSNSNGSPSTSSPKSLTGDSTGKPNGQDYDSYGNKISDNSIMNSYQLSSYYGYNYQNIADLNGEIPTIATPSPGSNGSPSSATPTSSNGNLNSSPNSKQKAVTTSTTTPPSNSNGSPSSATPTSSNGNSNSSPNSKQKAATTSTTTPTSNSNGSPSTSSPKSPTGDSTGKPNGQDYDSNGNKISDNSIMNSYLSASYYGYNFQNIADLNGEIPTIATPSPGSNGSPSSATPTSSNGNLNSSPNSKQKAATTSTTTPTSNSNGSPSSSSPKSLTGDSTGKPIGQDYDSNGNKISDNSIMNSYQSSSYYGYDFQNIADLYGEIPIIPTPSPGSNGSPSSATLTSTNGNLNRALNTNLNGGTPPTSTLPANSNGPPSSSYPIFPYGDSTKQSNLQDYDSNGNKLSDNGFMNGYQTSSYYGYIQNMVDQDTSYNYPPEMSEYLNNQQLQNSVSNFNLQNTATPDQFGIIPSSSLTMPNGNSKNSLSSGGTGLNTPTDMNGSPYTVDQSLTGTEYSTLSSDMYGSSNYDIDYELRNMDVVEVLNDGQLYMDDRYIPDNYNEVNNDGANIPLLNYNGDAYNNYFYADNSVRNVRGLNGNFDTLNGDNYVNGYMGIVPFDDSNMQRPSNEPYAPNLNDRYVNSQLQYGLNQNPPPYRGYPYMGNDITPFDTNIYSDISPQISVMNSDLYNYNKIEGIEYDQTKIGIEENSPENIQLSMSDLDTFSSNQISQTTDNFIDTDLTSDHLVYDFVDADNKDLETIDSNYIGQVNENRGQGFNGYNNMQSINVPEYNQFNGVYATTYLSNLGTYETSSSNTGTDAAVDGPEGPYLTPQLLNSNYNKPTSSDLNKQIADSNSLLIDNVQLNGYLYRKTDTSNVNTQVEGSDAVNANGSPMNGVDNRFKSIQTTDLSKNNELGVGQNVYGANGQVIGRIYKPSGIVKTKNRDRYSGSSSYRSPNDSEFSDDMHAIGHGIKRAARDAIGNVHDNIKDAYDTTKAVENIAGNAADKAADGIGQAAKTAYQDSKDAAKAVKKSVGEAADDVEKTSNTAYQGSKDAAKSVGNAVGEAANDVPEIAKTTYQGSKNVVNDIENAVSDATDDIEETA